MQEGKRKREREGGEAGRKRGRKSEGGRKKGMEEERKEEGKGRKVKEGKREEEGGREGSSKRVAVTHQTQHQSYSPRMQSSCSHCRQPCAVAVQRLWTECCRSQ